MEYSVVWARGTSGSSSLGLGWVLVIALGGGALLFLALGLLLAWHLKRRALPCTTRVYSWNGIPNSNSQPRQLPRGSTHRLLKKRLLANSQSELAGSGWSSRMSLALPVHPPVLPMPRHHSFRGRGRTRSWVNEEEIHGPAIKRRSWRESWFGTEGWFGRTPTVPDLNALENGTAPVQQDEPNGQRQIASAPCTPQRRHPIGARESPQHYNRHPQAQTPTRNPSLQRPTEGRIEVQKRDSRVQHQQQLHGTRSAPDLSEEYRGRIRAPAQAHVRPTITDTDLRDILHMTEQRLREGTSQSPNKTTPRTSPSKRSPVKTPRSYRSVSRTTSSPSKKTPISLSNAPQSRNASVSSIGSAANSLLAEATQQLELPGGMSSPSRLKGREWSAPPQPTDGDSAQSQNQSPTQLRYRKSMDSDVSSTLSTLYSAGEPEEPEGLAVRNAGGDDPFVENGGRRSPSWETRQLATDPRAFRRRTNVVSAIDTASSPVCSSACPSPLRPESTVDRTNGNRDSMSWVRQSIVLQPPTVRQCEDVEPKADIVAAQHGETSRQTSGSSMVSVSVHTDDDSDATELPVLMSSAKKTKGDDTHDEDTSSSSRPVTPTTPVRKRRTADMSSSPYNEQDILNILLSSAGPKRALPLPPPRVEGADDLGPTQLSPRPRSKTRTHTRPASMESDSSSNYEHDSFADDEDVVNPIIIAPSPHTLNVTNTISELRRMNSMISSYSVASIASTTLGDMESAAIPALRGGGFSPSRSQSRASLLGKKNYLSIGDHSPKKKVIATHQRTNSKKSLKAAEDDSPDKENTGRGLKSSRGAGNGSNGGIDSPNSGLREAKYGSGPRSKALSRENSASARGSPVSRREKKRLNPVDELAAEEKRLSRVSVDSLGLYDKDGFLVGSPEREKCLRM